MNRITFKELRYADVISHVSTRKSESRWHPHDS